MRSMTSREKFYVSMTLLVVAVLALGIISYNTPSSGSGVLKETAGAGAPKPFGNAQDKLPTKPTPAVVSVRSQGPTESTANWPSSSEEATKKCPLPKDPNARLVMARDSNEVGRRVMPRDKEFFEETLKKGEWSDWYVFDDAAHVKIYFFEPNTKVLVHFVDEYEVELTFDTFKHVPGVHIPEFTLYLLDAPGDSAKVTLRQNFR